MDGTVILTAIRSNQNAYDILRSFLLVASCFQVFVTFCYCYIKYHSFLLMKCGMWCEVAVTYSWMSVYSRQLMVSTSFFTHWTWNVFCTIMGAMICFHIGLTLNHFSSLYLIQINCVCCDFFSVLNSGIDGCAVSCAINLLQF